MFGNNKMADNKEKRDKKAELEKAIILDLEKVNQGKAEKKKRIIIGIMIGLLALVSVILGGFQITRAMGKNNLKKKAEVDAPVIETAPSEEITEEEEIVWKDGWVKHDGKIYAYNEDILTFLIMGIDKDEDVKEEEEGTDGGQADAIFLAVLNPHDDSIKVIGINRNTMTDIDLYNEEGSYIDTVKAQIAIQHGFGNGLEKSCEYQKKAVRNLMYQIPIHGYAAINMKAIADINDAVGGVTVVALEDIYLDKKEKIISVGDEKLLTGEEAYWYVRDRNMDAFGSADLRLARQKQYLNAFISKAKDSIKSDISVATDLYKEISKQMVTDVTLDEVAYLAPLIGEYSFTTEDFYAIKGETVMGEIFEEFYVDEDALYNLIINIFYEEVK